MSPADRAGAASPSDPSGWLAPAERRMLAEEVLIVLGLSLLPSAAYAVLDLLSAPLRGVVAFVYPNVDLIRQVLGILFPLVPVALVFYIARRSGEGLRPFGLATDTLGKDVAFGALLALIVSTVGLGLYLGAVALGVNRFVNPAPPLGHWWTVPVLVLGAMAAGLLEEVIVTGYLIHRLEQLGWATGMAVLTSAVLRASYHLYQGWGGFAGNLALGLFFGGVFVRWRRTWPLVFAHAFIDTLAGLGYILFHSHLPGP